MQNSFYFLVQLCFPHNYPRPSRFHLLPHSQAPCDCVIKIRILFLEICNSFSEIRRDLWSSYFYCKSNSLEKDVICRKALFLSQLHVKLNILCPELQAAGRGPSGNLGHARSIFVPLSVTVSLGLSNSLVFLLTVWTQNSQRPAGQARRERLRVDWFTQRKLPVLDAVSEERLGPPVCLAFGVIRPRGLRSPPAVPGRLRGHLDPPVR